MWHTLLRNPFYHFVSTGEKERECACVCHVSTIPYPVCVTWAHSPIQCVCECVLHEHTPLLSVLHEHTPLSSGILWQGLPKDTHFAFIFYLSLPTQVLILIQQAVYTLSHQGTWKLREYLKNIYALNNNLAEDNYWGLEMYVTLLTLLGTSCMPGTICKCLVSTDSLNPVSPFEVGIYDDCGTQFKRDKGGSQIWSWTTRSTTQYILCLPGEPVEGRPLILLLEHTQASHEHLRVNSLQRYGRCPSELSTCKLPALGAWKSSLLSFEGSHLLPPLVFQLKCWYKINPHIG